MALQKSLGLIETAGLAAAVEAADAAVKSANVTLVGYELARGGGWTTVKVEGDVGAVKAAVAAAAVAASKVNRVVSTRVIARPSDYLDMLVRNKNTVGFSATAPEAPKEEPETVSEPEPKPEQSEEEPKAETGGEASDEYAV